MLFRSHFRIFVRSFLERGILRWSPASRIERLVRVEGLEHLLAHEGRPLILLAPHFVGLEASGLRLAMHRKMVTMFSRQKDPPFDRFLYRYRTRFGGLAVSRQEGYRKAVRAIKGGVGGDNFGTVNGDSIDFVWRSETGGNGTFALK